MIYGYALVKKRFRCFFFQPPLTSVNRQIRSESLPILYGRSNFTIFFDGDTPSGGHRKLARLRKRWEILSPMSAMSPIPSFALVTKLDIQFSFSSAWNPRNQISFLIYMRNKVSDYAGSYKGVLVHEPGADWDWENVWLRCSRYTRRISRRTRSDWACEETAILVAGTVVFFADKCPLAFEWIWMEATSREDKRLTLS
jgi:hypothetical protein